MKEDEIEEIDVSEEILKDFEISTLSAENLVKVVQLLGYDLEQAQNLVDNTQATAINDLTAYKLYDAFKNNNLTLLPSILKPVKHKVVFIDDCQVLFLGLPNTRPLDEDRINWFREQLAPHYPDKIRSYTMVLTAPDGKKISLSLFNLLKAHQFDQIFEHYRQWFDQQSRWIGPKFDQIEKSLGKWLQNEVTKGIQPQQDEFISWFVTYRLGTLSLTFDLTFDKTSGYIVPGATVPVRLNVKNLSERFTPDVIQEDYIEFGLWKLSQAENSLQRVLAAQCTSNQKPLNDKLITALAPDEEQPKIFIPHQIQTRIFKTLSSLTPIDQHSNLSTLLEHGYSQSRIWVKTRADSLAYVFKQARETNNPILADMTETAKWLAASFSYGKHKSKNVSKDYAYKVLRGNTKVKKDYQIRLKL